ncbi:MAG: T9SS type A sorting domain-containing protein [Bacteroidota bacterium]|jgi:hypothetical protein
MKRIITLTLTIMCFATVQAQITITRTDIGNINDKVYYASRDTFSTTINIADTGTSKVWDFTSVIPLSHDSAMFLDPSTDPAAPADCNLIIEEGGEAVYVQINNDSMVIIQQDDQTGLGGSARALVFPMSKGTAFNDNIIISITSTPGDLGFPLPGDSIKIDAKIYTNTLADASGTLKTPEADYDVLRIASKVQTDITISILAFGMWTEFFRQQDTTYTYNWMSKNKKYYVATAEADKSGNVTSMRWQVSSVPAPVGLKKTIAQSSVKLFPNPVSTQLNVELAEGSAFTYTIYDINGRLVKSGSSAMASSRVDVNDLPNGIYHCHIETTTGQTSKRFVVTH